MRRLLWAGPVAAVGAAVANAVVFLVASGIGAIPGDVLIPNAGAPLSLGMVALSSAVPAIPAAIVFAVIGRFSRRPVRAFGVVTAVVLLLSFVTPFTVPGAPLAMILSMELMHVVAAGVIFYALTTLGRAG